MIEEKISSEPIEIGRQGQERKQAMQPEQQSSAAAVAVERHYASSNLENAILNEIVVGGLKRCYS
jgi:hypothetical protein